MTASKNEKIKINIDKAKLDIIAWLESLRWSNKESDTFDENDEKDLVVAYYCDDVLFDLKKIKKKSEETAEAVLLTHYLIYICNKQMDFRHIFKAGGYTISALVRDFFKNREEIKKQSDEKKKEEVKNLIEAHIVSAIKKDNDNDKFSFYLYSKINKSNEKDEENYKKYFQYVNFSEKDFKKLEEPTKTILTSDNYAKFSSRNMKADLYCIYKTFLNLALYHECSFANFIKHTTAHDEKKSLFYLARGFYELTYKFMPGTKNAPNDPDIVKVLSIYEENQEKLEISYDKEDFESEDFEKSKTFRKKRIWCVARDFVYQPIFRKCFKLIIGKDVEKLKDLEDCLDIENLELPGDVWNNNPKFAKCFWSEEIVGEINSSDFVRKIYDLSHCDKKEDSRFEIDGKWESGCYPKDFDVTFSFVPNMCSNDNCLLCPFEPKEAQAQDNKDKLERFKSSFCHGQKGKLCTFVLYTIGVKYNCPTPELCELLEKIEELMKR